MSLLVATATDGNARVLTRMAENKLGELDKLLKKYGSAPESAERINRGLFQNLERIAVTTIEDLWTDHPSLMPTDAGWWEVWLWVDHSRSTNTLPFRNAAAQLGATVAKHELQFIERAVILVHATPKQLRDPSLLWMIAELRSPREPVKPWLDLKPILQKEAIDSLAQRTTLPAATASSVCLLDNGLAANHPLIKPAIRANSVLAVNAEWGLADPLHDQHGTLMAGTALYGCLSKPIASTSPFSLPGWIESVNILSRKDDTPPELRGAITETAVGMMEAAEPARRRVYCLAVTEENESGCLSSSWSAAVDSLAYGNDHHRMICVAAGNAREWTTAYIYPEENLTWSIDSPGQAWNALTVGAYTEIDASDDPQYKPVAPRGDLSPFSRTGESWKDGDGWPFKPDVVFEGGNGGRDSTGFMAATADLSLLTTCIEKTGGLLTHTQGTSPAVAQAAMFAARLWERYPSMRADTLRGLVVHSARWTPAMLSRFGHDLRKCLRVYGYGVPDLDIAMSSYENALNLVYEGALTPFQLIDGSTTESYEMHAHALPWPKAALKALGRTVARMRVTLSYMVEPNPGRRSYESSASYCSHGLRFDVLRLGENLETLTKARSAHLDSGFSRGKVDSKWQLASTVQGEHWLARGSVHSDIWEGPAEELAERGGVVVYPVGGWWRTRYALGRCGRPAQYSLLIGISTPDQTAQLYSEVSSQIQTSQQIEI